MFQDILYEAKGGIATITINRPEVRNAVRPRTYEELTEAMKNAADDPEIGIVVLTGAGSKAILLRRRRQGPIRPSSPISAAPTCAGCSRFRPPCA